MPTPIVLNELSCAGWDESRSVAGELIRTFAQALGETAKLPRKVFLLSEESMASLDFGPFTFSSFLSDYACRDAIRLILTFASTSPIAGFRDIDMDGAECLVDGVSAKGLQCSHVLGTPLVSFAIASRWSGSAVEADLLEVHQDGGIATTKIRVPNIANCAHVSEHRQKLARFRNDEVLAGSDIWVNREDWFPTLQFLARVEDDLARLPGASSELEQVAVRLFELEESASEWKPRNGLPAWRSKVTPESEQRLNLCRFTGSDGVERAYEWHARFTPGAGRVHFRLLMEDGKFEVAYVGRKLGA